MNKHLFVIFLTVFSCDVVAMDHPGSGWCFDGSVQGQPLLRRGLHGGTVVVACGLETTVEELASSASSSQASSPEMERRVLAILQTNTQNEQQKAKAIVALLEASKK